MQDIKSKKGFTIIEVVLVLAIAGLIFLMVFIALPAMQRSQRDTQRRNDFSQFSASMTSYMTNNNGSLPQKFTNVAENATDASTADAGKYINSTGKDPNGMVYQLYVATCANNTSDSGFCTVTYGGTSAGSLSKIVNATTEAATKLILVKNAGCKDGKVVYKKSNRAFAVFGNLETGNGSYCSASS